MVTDRPARRRFPAADQSQRLAAVAGAAAGAIALTMMAEPGFHDRTHQMVIPLVACAPAVVLRRWPLPVLAMVTLGAGMVTALGAPSLSFSVLLGLTLYFSAVGLPRRRSIALVLAVAAALTAAIVFAVFAGRAAQFPAAVVLDLVPLAGAWFIADSVAARRRYQAGIAWQIELERAAEVREERVRIAREMHDVVAHTLAVMTVQAGVGRRLAAKRPAEATAALESIETIGRTAQDELRVVLGLLRDGDTGTAPLAPAPRLTDLTDLADTVSASGTPVELRISGADRQLSPSLELSIYRVAQEALTNVVKHAPGARATVELTVADDVVRLSIRDDGGAAPSPGPGTGHGITGMRERVGAFGGRLAAGPDGTGFLVMAEVPV